MTAILASPPFVTRGAEGLDRRGFTVDDVMRMVEAGIIGEQETFELIDGEIVPMAPEQSRHVVVKNLIARRLNALLPETIAAIVDSTLYLSARTFAEPDIYVVAVQPDLAKTPPGDVLLIIEVAASSSRHDLTLKAGLYARHGISEYWVVDADTLSTRIHRNPDGTAYADVTEHGPAALLSPARLDGVAFSVAASVRPAISE